MLLDFAPFAFVRLGTATSALAGHLLVTPRTLALVRSSSERIHEDTRLIAPDRQSVIAAALEEYTRWPLPVSLDADDLLHSLVLQMAPEAPRQDVVSVNVFSGAPRTLLNSLAAWRASEMMPSWPRFVDALRREARDAACPDAPLIVEHHRGADDAPMVTLTGASGAMLAVSMARPSARRVDVWLHDRDGQWTESGYRVEPDQEWERVAPQRRFATIDSVVSDLLRGRTGDGESLLMNRLDVPSACDKPERLLERWYGAVRVAFGRTAYDAARQRLAH